MVRQAVTNREIIERGKRIYDEQLRANAERDHLGEFIVVDIQSGDHQIGRNDIDATLVIRERRPDAILYGVRIGDDVAYRFGLGKMADAR